MRALLVVAVAVVALSCGTDDDALSPSASSAGVRELGRPRMRDASYDPVVPFEALELLEMLRARPDVTMAVAQEIDAFMAVAVKSAATALPPPPGEAPQPEREAAPRPRPPKRAKAEPVQIPLARLIELLSPFRDTELHVSPEIPEKTAKSARKALSVPKTEPIVALVNLAWFSAGENALVVTDRAIHHRKLGTETHIPFAELSASAVSLSGSVLNVGDHPLGVGGTSAPLPKLEKMLKALVKACEARRRESQGASSS